MVAILTPDTRSAESLVTALTGRVPVLMVVDEDPNAQDGKQPGSVAIVRRRLAGDFAAQRNAAQAAASTPWLLHLDTDERVGDALIGVLDDLTRRAEEAGLAAIGLPRRNFVGERLTDLFPDTQYRLVRREVRFEGPVHERPDACRDWPRTMVALTEALDHHLPAERLTARQATYDALGQDSQRRREAEALLVDYAA